MLIELRVANLGVIEELSLVFGPWMTAVTGYTGAGNTLFVEAIQLLLGVRAETFLVRPGAAEATVEGRFDLDGEEVVLARVVPRADRSRAYIGGRLATARDLAELGARIVDLHGQHAHQSLLTTAAQRRALDRFAAVDLGPLLAARAELAVTDEALEALGGDERARARELDLVRFQVDELEAAGLQDEDEDERLAAEEDVLGDATAHREAAEAAVAALAVDDGAADLVARAIGAVAARPPFALTEPRLRGIASELADVVAELRSLAETLVDDPARVEAVRTRRQALADLRRKYGATMVEVLEFRGQAQARLAELEGHDRRAAELDAIRRAAQERVRAAEAEVGTTRRAGAPRLAAAVAAHLADLALPRARLAIDVGHDPGDDVTYRLAANTGSPLLPLAKVASGGELARTMLALRLVLTEGPATLVFDEVDAGIGGTTASAVGRALSGVAAQHQVVVVTHLPQVAAFADAQVAVTKEDHRGRAFTRVEVLDDCARVFELSRILSGLPDSGTARGHAEELLFVAAQERGR
ncbi:DNA repair protein RecN [soil metagenome]